MRGFLYLCGPSQDLFCFEILAYFLVFPQRFVGDVLDKGICYGVEYMVPNVLRHLHLRR